MSALKMSSRVCSLQLWKTFGLFSIMKLWPKSATFVHPCLVRRVCGSLVGPLLSWWLGLAATVEACTDDIEVVNGHVVGAVAADKSTNDEEKLDCKVVGGTKAWLVFPADDNDDDDDCMSIKSMAPGAWVCCITVSTPLRSLRISCKSLLRYSATPLTQWLTVAPGRKSNEIFAKEKATSKERSCFHGKKTVFRLNLTEPTKRVCSHDSFQPVRI